MQKILLLLTLICFTAFQCICPKELKIGDKAPDFALLNQDGDIVHLADLKGKKVVLYFYPKDNTWGCSQQACNIRDNFQTLKDVGITIFGVSKGSIKSKQSFIKKKHLTFPLLIATRKMLKDYGVNGFFFPKRWTFLIDESGIIVAIIKNVDTKNHAQQILDAFDYLNNVSST